MTGEGLLGWFWGKDGDVVHICFLGMGMFDGWLGMGD